MSITLQELATHCHARLEGGKKRAKELLEVFGSVQGVKFASSEQLSEVVGEKTAQKILEYFVTDEALTEQNPHQNPL
jgi:ERCC4-type nuclease